MKRLLSLTLAAALLAALALPASAEEASAQDARLANVTQAVKTTLNLNTGAYEDFSGSLSEELVPVWDLDWQGERRSLSIRALEDGTVVSFSRWDYDPSPNASWNAFPSFPGGAGAGDREVAEDFLSRVLRPGETVELEEPEGSLSLSGSDSAWSGTVRLNGLPSPLHYSIRVENGMVEHFSRDLPETSVIGGVPSPDASAEKDKAAVNLKNTLELKLEYVFETPGAPRAILRYVPETVHTFLADAKTGEFLDLTELEKTMDLGYARASGGDNAAAAPTAKEMAFDEAELTQAEQEGVQNLEGVLSKDELDQALRAESAYGLRGYALTSYAYTPYANDDGKAGVDCELRYTRTDGGERLSRNITVDARTGTVRAVWSSAPYDRPAKLTEAQAKEQAEAYLKILCPDRAPVFYNAPENQAVPLKDKRDPSYLFRFARQENGIFFPSNLYEVSIDASDGSVYGLSVTWDEDVTFQNPAGVVSADAALAAWAETYETVLAYRNVPRKLSETDPIQARLLEQDMEYYYALRLTYGLEREGAYAGIDAMTGKPVREERGSAREAPVYTDLAGSAAKADIEKLARYGVGYAGGRFCPGRTVTQWELVCLAYSLQAPALDPASADKDQRDSAYYAAFRTGLLRQAERSDNAVLTRADLARMLLDAAGYGPAARLSGIYDCGYSDKGSIPEEELGYAAIAQALGMASGAYAGSRAATRGEAAFMLCRVLERAA